MMLSVPPGLMTRPHLAEGRVEAGEVVEDHRGDRAVELVVRKRQGVELAATELQRGARRRRCAQALLRLFEHSRRAVDADEPVAEGGQRARHVARAAAKVGEREAAGKEVGGGALACFAGLEERPDLVPVAGHPVEERAVVRVALGQDRREPQPVGLVLGDRVEVGGDSGP